MRVWPAGFVLPLAFAMASAVPPRVDPDDVRDALAVLANDQPWTDGLELTDTVLHDIAPLTVRLVLRRGASVHAFDCVRPWRTHEWMCGEAYDASSPPTSLR